MFKLCTAGSVRGLGVQVLGGRASSKWRSWVYSRGIVNSSERDVVVEEREAVNSGLLPGDPCGVDSGGRFAVELHHEVPSDDRMTPGGVQTGLVSTLLLHPLLQFTMTRQDHRFEPSEVSNAQISVPSLRTSYSRFSKELYSPSLAAYSVLRNPYTSSLSIPSRHQHLLKSSEPPTKVTLPSHHVLTKMYTHSLHLITQP